MKDFILNLQFIFKPDYWLMNHSYSKEVDSVVSDALDRYDFTIIDSYMAKLGNLVICISNEPYAGMIPVVHGTSTINARPSRTTIKRGYNKLKKQIKAHNAIKVKKQLEILKQQL